MAQTERNRVKVDAKLRDYISRDRNMPDTFSLGEVSKQEWFDFLDSWALMNKHAIAGVSSGS